MLLTPHFIPSEGYCFCCQFSRLLSFEMNRIRRVFRKKARCTCRSCQSVAEAARHQTFAARNVPTYLKRRQVRRKLEALLQEQESSNETERALYSLDVFCFLQRSDVDSCLLVNRQWYKTVCQNSSILPVYLLDRLRLSHLTKVSCE